MGKLTTYASLLLGITFMLYLTGYPSPFMEVMGNLDDPDIVGLLVSNILSALQDPAFLWTIGFASLGSLLLSGGGELISFLAPIFILTAVLNMFMLPTTTIINSTLPTELKFLITAILNILLILMVTEFIRGGST